MTLPSYFFLHLTKHLASPHMTKTSKYDVSSGTWLPSYDIIINMTYIKSNHILRNASGFTINKSNPFKMQLLSCCQATVYMSGNTLLYYNSSNS